MTTPRTVHVVDDDDAVREASEILLESAGYDVIPHDSGSAFIADLEGQPPGCVLLDMNMPGLSGLQVLAELKARGVGWPVIIRTGRGDLGIAVQAMRDGAFEYIEKAYRSEGLLETLGQAFEQLEHGTQDANFIATAGALTDTLTPREINVMRALLAGLPDKLIAHELGLSVPSVDIHRASIIGKLKARGLATAVRIALAAGLQPLAARRTAPEG
jgi:two-component system response regulator FixJ